MNKIVNIDHEINKFRFEKDGFKRILEDGYNGDIILDKLAGEEVVWALLGALLSDQADLANNLMGRDDWTRHDAVEIAAEANCRRLVDKLIDMGANIRFAVRGAARGGHANLVDELIERSKNMPSHSFESRVVDFAVSGAAKAGDGDLVRKLIDEQGANKKHAIMAAQAGGHKKLFADLIQNNKVTIFNAKLRAALRIAKVITFPRRQISFHSPQNMNNTPTISDKRDEGCLDKCHKYSPFSG